MARLKKALISTASYLLPVLIAVIALDVALGALGYGYPSHYEQENIERFPFPADSFRGKPNASDHNKFGFRGDFSDRPDRYNVAIFGGSTTYMGSPPIVDLIALELQSADLNFSIDTFNFGSVSSNHSQHVHRLIEFSDKFSFDLIIFYGGGNETLQYAMYDPRPGYPYNFFFRNELAPWKQMLLRLSSILGSIDIYSGGIISGLSELKRTQIDGEWQDRIVKNYWRDLRLASAISKNMVQPQLCDTTQFLSVTQPGNPATDMQRGLWRALLSSQSTFGSDVGWHHADFTQFESRIQFTDAIHVTQQSRKLIARRMAHIVAEILATECR